MKTKKIMSKLMIIITMIISMFTIMTNSAKADEVAPLAITDAAFPASSQGLHDAIMTKYPAIDTNGDGILSQGEASTYTGGIEITNASLTGTITGIEYFSNITKLHLQNNQLSGSIPAELGNNIGLTDLRLQSNNLSGNIPTELGQLVNLRFLLLSSNKLEGSIPESLGNLVNSIYFDLSNNQLSGQIPTSLGNLNGTSYLYLFNNNLTGTIPTELGNLTNLLILNLRDNQVSGSIPSSLGTLSKLKNLILMNNQLSGEIPIEIGNITTLENLNVALNSNLTGNMAEIFNNHLAIKEIFAHNTLVSSNKPNANTLDKFTFSPLNSGKDNITNGLTNDVLAELEESFNKFEERYGTSGGSWLTGINSLKDEIVIANDMLDAKDAVNNLYNPDSTINSNVTEEDINNANDSVSKLPDGELKDQLQDKIDAVQTYLDENLAREKVNNLFTDDTHTNIKDTTTQETINDAQNAVNKLPEGQVKEDLQKEIDKAQDMLNAKEAVEDLFDGNTIKDTVTQEDINNAQDLVNKLPNGSLKDELQAMIDEAQKQLNQKNTLITPTEVPTNASNNVNNSVHTSDIVNILPYVSLLLVSIGLFVVIKKRKIN
ncbi:MAG: toxin Cry1Ac domain D-VI-related protein [Coprobacillaceae bacterium]